MLQQLSIESIVDIGFVLLVCAACFKMLFGNAAQGLETKSQAWKEELSNLEGALKEVLEEARAASRNLDRTLLGRKRELEDVLKKLEGFDTAALSQPQPQMVATAQTQYQTRTAVPDLPNETWAQPLPQELRQSPVVPQPVPVAEQVAPQQTFQHRAVAPQPVFEAQNTIAEHALEQLANAADDAVSITSAPIQQALQPQMPEAPVEQVAVSAPSQPIELTEDNALSENIELIRQPEQQASSNQESADLSDPTTYNIAKRLLMDGQEIHVVARKLNLPAAEIRLLEKIIRQGTTDVTQTAAQPTAAPVQYGRSGIQTPAPAVEQPTNFEKGLLDSVEQVAESSDIRIDRESKLL